MVGNLIIISSTEETLATIGCYVYYIGLDITVVALLFFTMEYCRIKPSRANWHRWPIALAALDVLQLLANPITGHAFSIYQTIVSGFPYYALEPLAGQVFHRIVAYGIFFLSVGIFIYKTSRASRIYFERYAVILASMLLAGAWETYYIFSGSPIDQSMLGFGVFGLLVFYFSLYYKPFRILDRMLSRIVSSMSDAVLFFETNGTCIYANERVYALLGLDPSDKIPSTLLGDIQKVIGSWNHDFNSEWNELCRRGTDDDPRYYDVSMQQIRDEKKRHIGAALIVRDSTQEELKLQREKHLATHDRLTGLYNKEHLYDEVLRTIEANPEEKYLVVGLDIKDFKIINDIFSKDYGDRVLLNVADWLRSQTMPGMVYGRISGDKFGFIVPAESFDQQTFDAELRNNQIGDAGANYPIVIHLGIYELDEPGIPVSIMFDRAFMAIATIKHDFQIHIARFGKEMRERVIWNQRISGQLETAIAEGQIRPYLQPMVNDEGVVEGAEVLVRWIHPQEGFLSPARFIPVFESNGMIARLDKYMWECACQLLSEWSRRGIDLFLSVNISPKDFYFIDVYETITELVNRYNVDPAKLRLEITETVMMSDIENRLKILDELRANGFLVEIDDFGSGYSSLNMLKDMPVDILKIDMMFLYETKDQIKAETILRSIISLSDNLGIPSVTEGVETADQHDMLLKMGCRLFQGYFFAKPMPVEDFEKLMQAA